MKKYIVYCHHPKVIKNRFTHESIFVSCGHCPACIANRHSRYVSIMEEERKAHKYAFFCTLTYDDRFVPKLYVSKDKLWLFNTRLGVCIPYMSQFENAVDAHWFFNKEYFEFCYYKDVQDFIKRLRQYYLRHVPENELIVKEEFDYYDTKENVVRRKKIFETPRYYAVSELGPETMRPHFHLIVYFDSRWFAEHFERAFYTCWSLFDRHTRRRYCKGIRSECRPCQNDADEYTAAYCDAVVGLPALHQRKEISPRHTYSRFPSLGCFGWSESDLCQEIYSRGLRCYSGVDEEGCPIVVQVPQSIKNSLFPRCPEFNSIDDGSRIEYYRLFVFVLKQIGGALGYREFFEYVYGRVSEISKLFPSCARYLFNQSFHTSLKRPFYQLYLSGKRMVLNSLKYGFSFLEYIQLIIDYWSLQSYYRLRDWFEFMENYSRYNDVRTCYATYVNAAPKFVAQWSLEKSENYANMVSVTNKMQRHMTKSKKERDYQHRKNAVIYNPNNCLISNLNLYGRCSETNA